MEEEERPKGGEVPLPFELWTIILHQLAPPLSIYGHPTRGEPSPTCHFDFPQHRNAKRRLYTFHNWLPIALVSKEWRRVTLSLITHHECRSVQGDKEMKRTLKLLRKYCTRLYSLDLSNYFSDSSAPLLEGFKFPSSLRILHIRCRRDSPANELAFIPSHIHYLTLSNGDLQDHHFAHLPQNLKGLQIASCLEISEVALSYLPQNLRFLELDMGFMRKLNRDESSKKIRDDWGDLLPRNLLALRIGVSPGLGFLDISHVPPGLKTLVCTQQYGVPFRRTYSPYPESVVSQKVNMFESYPKTLTHITLSCGAENVSLSNAMLSQMFTSCSALRHLDLSYGTGFTDEPLKNLPETLHTLILAQCADLRMSFICDLPKGLHHLDVRAADYFGNQHLPLLPPELRILNCSATTVKNSGLFNMPKLYGVAERTCYDAFIPSMQHIVHSLLAAFCND